TTGALRHALSEYGEYRSLYVLDSTGAVLERVGQEPLRTIKHAPTGGGITRGNTSRRLPALAAYVQIPAQPPPPRVPTALTPTASGRGVPAVLFGEIDVHALDNALTRPGLGSVWLTDDQHRVLAATVGFRAFQSLPDPALTQLAASTNGAAGTAGTS